LIVQLVSACLSVIVGNGEPEVKRSRSFSYIFLIGAVWILFCGITQVFAGAEDFLRFRLGLKTTSIPVIEGFSEFVSGENLNYFSHRGANSVAHIARADGERQNMFEWRTASLPANWKGGQASFIWVAGIGANQGSRNFSLFVDGKERFVFSTCADQAWTVKGRDGGELSFVAVTPDGYGDLFGYMKLTVPGSWLTSGKPLTLKIAGEKAGSDAWVMVFKFTNAFSAMEPVDRDVFYNIQMRNWLMTAVNVVSPRTDWAGKTLSLVYGKQKVGEAPLTLDRGIVKAAIRLSPHLQVQAGEACYLAVDGNEIERLDSTKYARDRLLAFLDEELEFSQKVFPPGEFPKVTWKRPAMVDNEMGEFDLKVTFYDAKYKVVKKAEKPGRYGAVVEAVLADGYHLKRYVTLYCGEEKMSPQTGGIHLHVDRFAPLGLSESAWKARQTMIDKNMGDSLSAGYMDNLGDIGLIMMLDTVRWKGPGGRTPDTGSLAVILAAASDLGDTAVSPSYKEYPFNLDRQWWATFKRLESGVENKYPALKPPVKDDQKKTTVLHEGDPASVGYSPEQIEAIRQVCRDWAKDGREPLSVLVARKGVIVLHEAFGEYPDGRKLTLDSPTWMASVTKLMNGCLMMQFVDQGLVNLDDPVSKYLPEFDCKAMKTPLTIRHLYTHTSGFWGHGTWGADWNNSFENMAGEYLPYLEVGRKKEYNGIGYTLAGKIMERISGKTLPFLYQDQLFGPLGDEHTTVQGGSGDTRSVCMDMGKVAQMLLNQGCYGNLHFFSEASFQKMMPIRLDKLVPGSTEEWGVGVTWSTFEGVTNRTFGHGAASGAVFQIDPKNELIIICCREQVGLNHFDNVQKFMRACTAPFNASTSVLPKK
jgi:CubicO group peptidase (beta-lactamase class C family)